MTQSRQLLKETKREPLFALQSLLRRLPQWASWSIVVVIAVGLTLRYAYALMSRSHWQRQHPEGNWISRYYPSTNFKGYPLVRYDTGINYQWGKGAPAQAMDPDHWSARWDTCLIVKENIDLRLLLVADDSATLKVDEVARLEVKKPGQAESSISINQGVHRLRVDFEEERGSAKVRLGGLDFDGTENYEFRRPQLDGDSIRCP
jgi:hypothetical protein